MTSRARRLGVDAVAALRRGDTAAALALIDQGAHVNARDETLDSVLLYAGAHGHDEVVRAALAAGGDLSVTNRFGGVALIPASEKGHVSRGSSPRGTAIRRSSPSSTRTRCRDRPACAR